MNAARLPLIAALACTASSMLMSGCSGRGANLEVAARSQAVITIAVASAERFELRNHGPAAVRLILARRGQRDTDLSLGSSGLYMSSLEGVQSIVLRNDGQLTAELSLRVGDRNVELNIEHSSLAEQSPGAR